MPYLFLFAAFLVFMYLTLLRPQQQRVRKQQELLNAIQVGDYVVTVGGIVGRVAAIANDRVQVEIADGVVVEFLRLAVNRRIEASEVVFETTLADEAGADTGTHDGGTDDGGVEAGPDVLNSDGGVKAGPEAEVSQPAEQDPH